MDIKIALAGNPNCGKTTLFNDLTGSNQYVGNRPGVTVEKKEGKLKSHKDVVIQDLPGIYFLSPYTLEEVVARSYLVGEKPDAILNIVDGTNIERNLYLTTRLIELSLSVPAAVNMTDLVRKNGDQINLQRLAEALRCEVVEMSALKGEGGIAAAEKAMALGRAQKAGELPHVFTGSVESIITNRRYSYIGGVVNKAVKRQRAKHGLSAPGKIARVVTNRVLALPIFAVVMFAVYWVAMGPLGAFLTDWTNDVLGAAWMQEGSRALLEGWGVAGWLTGLISDGIVAGAGAVLGFVSQMLVLFFMLAILEDVGYMARIAFIMDRIFRKFGLSGKSFIPMLVSTGCGAPA